MIYTIGYSKWTVDRLLKVMGQKEIDRLVDVRSVPFSRFNPPFGRTNLSRVLKDAYLWKGQVLGGKYGPATDEGIAWLVGERKARPGGNIVIMCAEADPRKCHRLTDISLRLLLEHGIDAVHLLDDGAERTTSCYYGNLGGD
jgi:uncharacterized protein (DUF488 family)